MALSFHFRRVDCDIVMDTIADEEAQRESHIKWSTPYQQSGVALAVRPGADGITGFDSLDARYRVGVLAGLARAYVPGSARRPCDPYGFESDLLEALANGEIDAAAITALSAGYYNLQHPQAPLHLIYAYDAVPELGWDLAVGMRLSDQPLIDAVDSAVKAMLADGTFDRIYASYGIEHRQP